MAFIQFDKVCVDFPIYSASSRSLKKRLLEVATGGQLNTDPHGHVVVRALRDLNLTLRDGDRVGLLGHNGAGKSTMLRLLGGVYEPSAGTARIDGKITSLIDILLGIDREATGRENIYFRGTLLGMSKSHIQRRMEEIVDFSELGDFIDMPLHTYSSGMHLRLAFAVSTIMQPEILVMDEWLSVGDEGFKRKAEARLAELVQASNILVIASHSRELILRTCNRVIWLEHGAIRMDGPAEAVAAEYFPPEEKPAQAPPNPEPVPVICAPAPEPAPAIPLAPVPKVRAPYIVPSEPLILTEAEQATLRELAIFHAHPNTRRRAQGLLRLHLGWTYQRAADDLDAHETHVIRWRQRWDAVGLVGLIEAHLPVLSKILGNRQIDPA